MKYYRRALGGSEHAVAFNKTIFNFRDTSIPQSHRARISMSQTLPRATKLTTSLQAEISFDILFDTTTKYLSDFPTCQIGTLLLPREVSLPSLAYCGEKQTFLQTLTFEHENLDTAAKYRTRGLRDVFPDGQLKIKMEEAEDPAKSGISKLSKL